ncbi:uncharacterized protein PHACADRAFT_190879 [Phanerochaete carnosa HHB-10118-sp]|uniref:Uncharacterized protein n=1 Tax=Phanerochaete carnosa (strain HHB-10118-sp) TaxID=650164 RepID=K5WR12_PHACS|nr:uncharacterized protein PHACADRAFT_190879 [Phanerochaete carnosa HHB-10118-sp]EKM61699.1 hypothetical protein PHACADRAFT_190879 [Phanerochaete carnosa HHB-10118-sp]
MPIVYQDAGITTRAVFRAGGLLLVFVEEPEEACMAVPPGTALEDVVAALEADWYAFPEICEDLHRESVQLQAFARWDAELKCGRNRWIELKDRGGDVHPDWLVTTCEYRFRWPGSWKWDVPGV